MQERSTTQERTAGKAANHPVSTDGTDNVAGPCLPQSPQCWQQVHLTLELIASKWAVPLMLTLYARSPLRYSAIADGLTGISAKEMAKQLRSLEAAGIIRRVVLPSKPPAVEYALTDMGITLQPVLTQLASWSALHGEQVRRNRMTALHPEAAEPASRSRVHRIR